MPHLKVNDQLEYVPRWMVEHAPFTLAKIPTTHENKKVGNYWIVGRDGWRANRILKRRRHARETAAEWNEKVALYIMLQE